MPKIARISGKLAHNEGNILIVDVNGVGYRVTVPVNVLGEIAVDAGMAVTLFTHLVVREDELSLYGFSTHAQLKAFEILIGVTGVGPKVALAVLSTMDVPTLAYAISIGDTRALAQAPGLGPKTAQRLALELRDKMAALVKSSPAAPVGASPQKPAASGDQFQSDIVEALVGLGYNRRDAEKAAERVSRESAPGEPLTSAKALREALNVLTGNR